MENFVHREHKKTRIKEECDIPEIKFSNTQDYLNIQREVNREPDRDAPEAMSTAIKEELATTVTSTQHLTDVSYPVQVKQELSVEFDPLLVENEDPRTDCSDNGIEDNNSEHITNSDDKQKPKVSADLGLIKEERSWEVTLQRLPAYKHTDIKQEPIGVDQTDPDDVTKQLIPEGSEQHEMEDVKYANSQDFLDIGETIVSEQDRAISEQDRATPGTSSKGGMRCQTNVPKTGETTLLAGRKQFECDICGYGFRRRVNLKRHMRTHIGEKPHKCEICDYRCRESTYLKLHMRIHTGYNPYKCEICDFQCKQLGNLKRHVRTHTGEKPYKCEICDYKCITQGSLKRHTKSHTGDKPYKCEICEYKSSTKDKLKIHMRTHSGEKPYMCEICEYRCSRLGNLNTHKGVHTGEKPYKCETCHFKCRTRSNLMTHMRMHTGDKPYKCEICDYQSRQLGGLKRHMRMHTGEKPFKCKICDYRCRAQGNLKRHVKTHTEEKPFK